MQTPDDIQARIDAFMEARGGYVASASEGELFRLLASYGDARAAQERERCLAAIDGLYHGDAARAAIRALANADQPGA